jgi:hypothetical protein
VKNELLSKPLLFQICNLRRYTVDPKLMAELVGDDDDDDADDEMIVPLGYRDAHTPQLEVGLP